jgi:HlyD family secretion protein
MRWLMRLLLAGGFVLLLVIGFVSWTSPVEVETASVRRATFEETIREDGQTRVRERYAVAAPVSGTLRRIVLNAGDPVAAGAIVAAILPNRVPLLDPRARQEAEQRLGAAEAALARAAAVAAQAEAVAAQARVDEARSRTLAAQGAVPHSRLERDVLASHTADRELDAARLAHHAAMHEMEVARAALWVESEDRHAGTAFPVRAPIAGRVLRLPRKSESPVSLGESLVEIGDPTDLEVVADLLTTDAVRVHTGDQVRIEGWGGAAPLTGRVRLVEPGAFTKVSALGVDEQRTNVVIDITSPVSERPSLGDAYRVDIQVIVAKLEDATVIPAGALFRNHDGWSVFAVVDGRARRRAVTLAGRNAAEAAVSRGLGAGEQVILFPGDSVVEDVRVHAR